LPVELLAVLDSKQIPELLANPGATFEHGFYRIHNADSYGSILEPLRELYAGEKLVPFAFDWLGRQFTVRGEAEIVVCDPGWNDKLVADVSLAEFAEEVLPREGETLLRADLWRSARKASPRDLAFDECFGYDTPVFLGGADEAENLSRTPVRVYWDLLSQLAAQVAGLPEGTEMRGVELEADDR
jgi:hypothetical protein